MCKVRINYLLHILILRHFVSIFIMLDYEFKSPQAVFMQAKTATDGRSIWIADEPEVEREEGIVDLLGRISLSP